MLSILLCLHLDDILSIGVHLIVGLFLPFLLSLGLLDRLATGASETCLPSDDTLVIPSSRKHEAIVEAELHLRDMGRMASEADALGFGDDAGKREEVHLAEVISCDQKLLVVGTADGIHVGAVNPWENTLGVEAQSASPCEPTDVFARGRAGILGRVYRVELQPVVLSVDYEHGSVFGVVEMSQSTRQGCLDGFLYKGSIS